MENTTNQPDEKGHDANIVLAAGAPNPKLSTDSKALDCVPEKRGLVIGATSKSFPDENWIDVFGAEDYMVSTLGRIKAKRRMTRCGRYWLKEQILKPYFNQNGIATIPLTIGLSRKKFPISRLMVSSFMRKSIDEIFTDNNICVHYKNYDSTDLSIQNLELTSHGIIGKKSYLMGRTFLEKAWVVSIESAIRKQDEFNIYDSGVLVERICKRCTQQLDISEFHWDSVNRMECKRCSQIRRGIIDIGRNKRVIELKRCGLKKCCNCGIVKSIDNDFHKKTAKCKKCKKIERSV